MLARQREILFINLFFAFAGAVQVADQVKLPRRVVSGVIRSGTTGPGRRGQFLDF